MMGWSYLDVPWRCIRVLLPGIQVLSESEIKVMTYLQDAEDQNRDSLTK